MSSLTYSQLMERREKQTKKQIRKDLGELREICMDGRATPIEFDEFGKVQLRLQNGYSKYDHRFQEKILKNMGFSFRSFRNLERKELRVFGYKRKWNKLAEKKNSAEFSPCLICGGERLYQSDHTEHNRKPEIEGHSYISDCCCRHPVCIEKSTKFYRSLEAPKRKNWDMLMDLTILAEEMMDLIKIYLRFSYEIKKRGKRNVN